MADVESVFPDFRTTSCPFCNGDLRIPVTVPLPSEDFRDCRLVRIVYELICGHCGRELEIATNTGVMNVL